MKLPKVMITVKKSRMGTCSSIHALEIQYKETLIESGRGKLKTDVRRDLIHTFHN